MTISDLIPWKRTKAVPMRREDEPLLFQAQTELNRLFDDFFARSPFGGYSERGDWMPAVDISENEKEIEIHAEVPGMEGKDIDIST